MLDAARKTARLKDRLAAQGVQVIYAESPQAKRQALDYMHAVLRCEVRESDGEMPARCLKHLRGEALETKV